MGEPGGGGEGDGEEGEVNVLEPDGALKDLAAVGEGFGECVVGEIGRGETLDGEGRGGGEGEDGDQKERE